MGIKESLSSFGGKIKSTFTRDKGSFVFEHNLNSSYVSGGANLKRIDRSKLSKVYMLDGMTNSNINTLTDYTVGSKYDIEGEHASNIKQFLDESNVDFLNFLENVVRDCFKYGNAYVELIRGQANEVVGFRIVDATMIQYTKNLEDPELDMEYYPKTYFEKKDDKLEYREIDKEDMVHIRLIDIIGEPDGLGLIEPLYKNIIVKLNIEDSFGEIAHKLANPIYHVAVGDEHHIPSKDERGRIKREMKSKTGMNVIVTDGKSSINEVGDFTDKPFTGLDNIIQEEISVFGVPLIFLPGYEENFSSGLADKFTNQFVKRVEKHRSRVEPGINELFARVLESKGIDRENQDFEFKWDDVVRDTLSSKLQRMAQITYAGHLTPSPETEEKIREWEDLPELDLDWHQADEARREVARLRREMEEE